MSYRAIAAVAAALLDDGRPLQACDVTAGAGLVVDWRYSANGECLISGADAFDTARAFVAAVGSESALEAVRGAHGKAAA